MKLYTSNFLNGSRSKVAQVEKYYMSPKIAFQFQLQTHLTNSLPNQDSYRKKSVASLCTIISSIEKALWPDA